MRTVEQLARARVKRVELEEGVIPAFNNVAMIVDWHALLRAAGRSDFKHMRLILDIYEALPESHKDLVRDASILIHEAICASREVGDTLGVAMGQRYPEADTERRTEPAQASPAGGQ